MGVLRLFAGENCPKQGEMGSVCGFALPVGNGADAVLRARRTVIIITERMCGINGSSGDESDG